MKAKLFWVICAALAFACTNSASLVAAPSQFKADFYERDISTNRTRGRGNVWLRRGEQEVWCDEIEVDEAKDTAVARGHVHLRKGPLDIWSERMEYDLGKTTGTFEEATLSSGQLVLTGRILRKTSAVHYEVLDGTYTNCNLAYGKSDTLGGCPYEWKLHGQSIDVTMEGYTHIKDAILYAKELPLLYVPYLIVPLKTKRQSGFLWPLISSSGNLGSGYGLPYYWAISPWQDLTITPTWFTKHGYHANIEYRYLYSNSLSGYARTSFMWRRLGLGVDSALDDSGRERFLGFIGDTAFDIRNTYAINERAHIRQLIRFASNPYYTQDYGDFGVLGQFASLRSFASVTVPGNDGVVSLKAEHNESLLITKERGIDKGAPSLLPSLKYSLTSLPLLGNFMAFELDTQFANYYRPTEFDQVPEAKEDAIDVNPQFDANDYLRTGRRLRVEPRFIFNIPTFRGVSLQPTLKLGALLYHFDLQTPGASDPNGSSFAHREYLGAEIPFSFYLSRRFHTSIEGFEKITHVLQPRVIFVSNALQTPEPNHVFFYRNRNELSNPRFDLVDQLLPSEYVRFELINRFLRLGPTATERFFLLQIAEQYNFSVIANENNPAVAGIDPRFKYHAGPLEVVGAFGLGPFGLSLGGKIALESDTTVSPPVQEQEWSGEIKYKKGPNDYLQFNGRVLASANSALSDQKVSFSFAKSLPVLFDLAGNVEYSVKLNRVVAYEGRLFFESRPKTCWAVGLVSGRDATNNSYVRLTFRLDFGNPTDLIPL